MQNNGKLWSLMEFFCVERRDFRREEEGQEILYLEQMKCTV